MEANTETKTGAESVNKHEFEAVDYYKSLTDKLLEAIVRTVNEAHKGIPIIKLDTFQEHFLVRNGHNGKTTEALYDELSRGRVENLGFVTLQATDDVNKKIIFGLWRNLGGSQVLI